MSVVPFECEYCHSQWTNPIAAAMCCDAVSNDLDED